MLAISRSAADFSNRRGAGSAFAQQRAGDMGELREMVIEKVPITGFGHSGAGAIVYTLASPQSASWIIPTQEKTIAPVNRLVGILRHETSEQANRNVLRDELDRTVAQGDMETARMERERLTAAVDGRGTWPAVGSGAFSRPRTPEPTG